MKHDVPVFIAGILVVTLGVRLWLRRRRRRSRSHAPRGSLRLSSLAGDTGLVAAREIRARVRTRAFRLVTAVLLLAVAAAIVVPSLTKGTSGPQRVGVVGTLSQSQRAAITGAARSVGTAVELLPQASTSAASDALRSGHIDVAVVDGARLVVNKPSAAAGSSTTARLVTAAAADLGLEEAFVAAGLSPAQASRIAGAHPVAVTSLQPAAPRSGASTAASVVGVIIIFVMLSQYETWTLIGVMEEKSSRVVEVLLATVRPIQLLGGKVLGIGLVALAQAAALLAVALLLSKAVGSDLLRGTAPLMLAAAFFWLVIGYAFYCWVYAAAGSMAERQDQVQTLALPLSLPMILGYVMALTAASSGHASVFFQVLAYLPPTAPFVMPVLVGLGAVSWWGFVASVALSLASTVLVARAAAAVYRRAVLRTGRRVALREVI